MNLCTLATSPSCEPFAFQHYRDEIEEELNPLTNELNDKALKINPEDENSTRKILNEIERINGELDERLYALQRSKQLISEADVLRQKIEENLNQVLDVFQQPIRQNFDSLPQLRSHYNQLRVKKSSLGKILFIFGRIFSLRSKSIWINGKRLNTKSRFVENVAKNF